MAIGVLVSMLMTNTYTMPMWWVLVGLGLVLSDIERSPAVESAVPARSPAGAGAAFPSRPPPTLTAQA